MNMFIDVLFSMNIFFDEQISMNMFFDERFSINTVFDELFLMNYRNTYHFYVYFQGLLCHLISVSPRWIIYVR